MPRRRWKRVTERELEIMQVFWDASAGEPTVGDVQRRLAHSGRPLALTTVATLMGILVRKGYLARDIHHRPHRYRALCTRQEISRNAVGDMVKRFFRGSRTALIRCLLGQSSLTADEQAELKRFLKERPE